MRQVAGEVVGGKLVGGVEALVAQVVGPFGELRPVLAGEVPVAQFALHGGDQDEQVAALFDRHLVFFGALAAAVDLAVGQRIGAQIVRARRATSSAAGRHIRAPA